MCLLRPAMQCWNRPKGHANITAVDVPGFTAKLTIQEVREVILPEGPFLEIWIIFFLEGHGLEAVPSHRFDFEKTFASRTIIQHSCCIEGTSITLVLPVDRGIACILFPTILKEQGLQ